MVLDIIIFKGQLRKNLRLYYRPELLAYFSGTEEGKPLQKILNNLAFICHT
jgi:hypothetical protein